MPRIRIFPLDPKYAHGMLAQVARQVQASGRRIENMSTDSGFTSCLRHRQARRHAFYKIVALVQGTNIVRRELGLPVADCLAADPHLSLVPPGN
jgi:5-methyltetrahydropteroyltriglutamate--homocysteine methyltransferase